MGVHVVEERGKSGPESGSVKFHCSSSSSSSSTTLRLASAPLRLFKSRSKSQSRIALASRSCWVPEGRGRWKNSNGHVVDLKDVPLVDVTESERIALQRLALTRLQELNLGCHVEIPKIEDAATHHPKRRPMLLRKKAATTNFFEGKEKGSSVRGAVFGIPLTQCVTNDRIRTAEPDLLNPSGQDHCEEVLSALRITHGNDNKSVSSREGSLSDIRGNETQEKGSTESLSSIEGNIRGGDFVTRRTGRGSSMSLYGGGNQVPQVVDSCMDFLENKGLNTLGIFRVSGSKKRIRQLREDLDNNQRLTFDDSNQPHDIAQLLKEFFRELPEPLLTRDLYRAFLEVQRLRDPRQRIEATRWLLYLLPVSHRDTLAALLTFLGKVVEASEDRRKRDGTWEMGNKMNSSNLATVFGPNLLRMSKGSNEMPYAVQSVVRAQERCDVIQTVCHLIENHKTLLQVPYMDLDAIYKNMMVDDPELLNALLNRHPCNTGYNMNMQMTESRDNQCCTGRINEGWATDAMQTSKESPILKKPTHKKEMESHFTEEHNIKSRIRPLIFSKNEYGSQGNLVNIVQERTSSRGIKMTEVSQEPYGVSASFTVTMAGKNQAEIPQLRILESDQGAQTKSRHVPYGKIRHLTTPSYVTEEMSITITIPARKQITQKLTKESESLMLRNLSPWSTTDLHNQSNKKFSSDVRGPVTTDIRMKMRTTEIGHFSRSTPSTQERWKRQEIIASEHVQL